MKAKVVTSFPGRRDNSGESETFAVDTIIEGDLAHVAVDNGWAQELVEETDSSKVIKAQTAVDTAQAAFDVAKAALESADADSKADAQKKHDAAEAKLKSAQTKLENLTKA